VQGRRFLVAASNHLFALWSIKIKDATMRLAGQDFTAFSQSL
jgi:hypothetical protein